MLVAGCGGDGDASGGLTVVAGNGYADTPAESTIQSPPGSARRNDPVASETIRRIGPPREAPPLSAPTGPLPTRKTFVDPPLPAELKDDGGLTPLPPPPPIAPRGATGTGGMP